MMRKKREDKENMKGRKEDKGKERAKQSIIDGGGKEENITGREQEGGKQT